MHRFVLRCLVLSIALTQGLFLLGDGNSKHGHDRRNTLLEVQYGSEMACKILTVIQIPEGVSLGDVWSDLEPSRIQALQGLGIDEPLEFQEYTLEDYQAESNRPGGIRLSGFITPLTWLISLLHALD